MDVTGARIWVRSKRTYFECGCGSTEFAYLKGVPDVGDVFQCVRCAQFYYDEKGAIPTVDACPECRAGKHQNCGGDSWDIVKDEPAPCPCYLTDPEVHRE